MRGKPRARASWSVAIVLIPFVVGCAADASSGRGGTSTAPAPPPPATTPTIPAAPAPVSSTSPLPVLSPESSSAPDPTPVVAAAQADAARVAGVSPADVKVEQVEAREWGDSSLGCPRPDSMYSQIVTPGFLVVVTVAGRTFEYHADARGRVELCQER